LSMLIYPLFRFTAARDPGISIIAQGSEVVGNPDVTVTLTKSNGAVVNLTVVAKRVKDDVMFIHAKPPGAGPTPTALALAAGDDGGIGSITVTVTGTTNGITAQFGYGDPSSGLPPSQPPNPTI